MAKKTMDVAREVIAGDWGSGDKRKEALTKAGYNYDEVQKEVNRLLCCRELIIQNIKAWANKIADSKKYKYVLWTEPYGHECAVCHPHEGKNHGWQCIGFASACWHHGGLPSKCYCGTIDDGTAEKIMKAKTDEEALRLARKGLGINDIQVIRNNGKAIPKEKAKAGDLALLFNGDAFKHMYVIMSDKYIADSTRAGGYGKDISATRKFSGRYVTGMKVLIRYIGKGITKPVEKSVDALAHEVIDGKWGSGDSRKIALTECGYDYDAVQKRVNEILNPPKPTPSKGSYTGKFPNYRLVKTNAQVIADTIKWAKWIAGNNDFHYGYGTHAHHNGCYFCGTQRLKKGHGIKEYEYTYCCNPFVGAAWAHGGGDATAYKMCHNCNSWDFGTGKGSYHSSTLFDNLGHPSKSKLKAGDVLCNGSHVVLYIGNGKIAEASGGDNNVPGSKSWNNSIHVTDLTDSRYKGLPRAYRYNGSVNANRPLSHGEVSDRVADLQRFLVWYGYKITVDAIFGDGTLNALKAFQEKEMGKGQNDGIAGPATITAMKKVKK